MLIRHATPADFSAIADLCVLAFEGDNLFDYLHPYSKEYPEDFRDVFVRSVKSRYYDPETHIMLAVSEPGDAYFKDHSEVLGYAAWTLEGPNIKPPLDVRRIACRVEVELLKLEKKYKEYFDRSMSRERSLAFRKHLTGPHFFSDLDSWYLHFLAVSTKHHRLGIGGRLMDWGMSKALEANLPAVLYASPAGRGLYSKKGFKTIGLLNFPPGNGMNMAMLWEPPGYEGVFRKMVREAAPTEEPGVELVE